MTRRKKLRDLYESLSVTTRAIKRQLNKGLAKEYILIEEWE